MALWKFLRGIAANLENSNIEDGTFHYTTDGKKLYLDFGQSREILNPNPDQDASSGNAAILNKPTKLSDFINDIDAGGSSGAMTYEDIVVTSVTSTSSYSQYSYVFNYSQTGMTNTTYVYGALPNNDYSASWGVESTNGSVNILFASMPTLPITVRVYAFNTSVSSGMTYAHYSISSVSASSTYPGFNYEYYISNASVKSDSYIDAEIISPYSGNVAVSSINGGIYVYFSTAPTSYPFEFNIYVYCDVINVTPSGSSLMYFTETISTVTSSSAHAGYPYAHAITVQDIDETTKADINIDKSDYDGSYAIESTTDTLTVYFAEMPTLPLTAKIQYQIATPV